MSDGIDTCAPPVCEVAKRLKDQGTDLVVHTIGFKVDDAARAELSCVAEVTGGTYADASSVKSLKAALTQAAKRTAVGYQFPAETVKFSTSQTDAPTIEPGTLTNPNRITAKLPITRSEDTEEFYAKVSIPKGHRLHVGFAAVPEVGTRDYLSSFTYTPDLFPKEHSSCYEWREEAGNTTGGRPLSGYIISRVEGEACNDTLYFLNLEGRTKDAPDNVDMFLATVPEPTDLGDDFNKTPSNQRIAADLGAPADLSHVTSDTPLSFPDPDAPEVEGTVEAEIVEGQTQYFATPIAQPTQSEKSGIGMVWWFVIGAALLLLAAVMVVLSRLAKRST